MVASRVVELASLFSLYAYFGMDNVSFCRSLGGNDILFTVLQIIVLYHIFLSVKAEKIRNACDYLKCNSPIGVVEFYRG